MSSRSPSYGFCRPMRVAKIAAAVTASSQIKATLMPAGNLRRTTPIVVGSATDAMAHPWVEHRIHHVDGDIDDDKADRDHQHHALNHEIVALIDGIDHHLADAG